MSTKLKALGLGILALVAMSVSPAMNAAAEPGGHFVSEVAHTTLVGTEGSIGEQKHRLHVEAHGLGGKAGCAKSSYHGTLIEATVEAVTIDPSWSECYTTPDQTPTWEIHENDCDFTFTITKGAVDHTVHLGCPPDKAIEITHPNCNITVAPQIVDNAVTYTTTVENNKHAITLDVNAEFVMQYHGGICIFTGTNHTGTLSGSLTIKGLDTAGNQVSITAT